MSASVTIESTGEVLDFEYGTPEQLISSYKLVNDYIEAYEALKKKLQARAIEVIDNEGFNGSIERNGYILRSYTTQRRNYDAAVLRSIFDEDEMALFMEPAKGRIDRYIRDHLAELGITSTVLRDTMVPAGKPYSVVRLERLS